MEERVAQPAEELGAALTGVEELLMQVRSESGQDPIRFPGQLDNQLVELYGFVTGPDGYIAGGPEGRPTAAAYERFDELNQEWSTLRERLRVLIEDDVTRFNELMRELGLPAIVLEARRPIA
jgi:hypothetical protein